VRVGLAQDDGSGFAQPPYRLGVLLGDVPGEVSRTRGRRQAAYIDHVLDRDGDAVQGPAVHPGGQFPGRLVRSRQGSLLVEGDEGVDHRLQAFGFTERRLRQGPRGHKAGAQPIRQLGDADPGEVAGAGWRTAAGVGC
jgi:hypothetical protein